MLEWDLRAALESLDLEQKEASAVLAHVDSAAAAVQRSNTRSSDHLSRTASQAPLPLRLLFFFSFAIVCRPPEARTHSQAWEGPIGSTGVTAVASAAPPLVRNRPGQAGARLGLGLAPKRIPSGQGQCQ